MPSTFPFIYHHKQIYGVHSSREGRYIPPISPLPLYILCGIASELESICWRNDLKLMQEWVTRSNGLFSVFIFLLGQGYTIHTQESSRVIHITQPFLQQLPMSPASPPSLNPLPDSPLASPLSDGPRSIGPSKKDDI
jgi:hypothetical protein